MGSKNLKLRTLRLVATAAAGLLVASPAPAQAGPGGNAACLACHGAVSRLPAKAAINEADLEASVHAALSCTDCHEAAGVRGSGGEPHEAALPDVNCTSRCHREPRDQPGALSPLDYPDSIHGSSYRRGVKEVARCWDCHGKHSIRPASDPESLSNRRNIPLNCSRCHDDMAVVVKYHIHSERPYAEYLRSVHGRSLQDNKQFEFAAVCTDCHGVHNISGLESVERLARKPQTCGRCHPDEFERYSRGIHGREALKGNFDAPVCSDCHGEHDITPPSDDGASTSRLRIHRTCAECHARPELAQKYGIPSKRVLTFIESRHGIAIESGRKSAATCSSCHGVHDILPASDVRSPANPLNLPRTCGQKNCHPGMPEAVARAQIHRSVEDRDSGAPFTVLNILLALVVTAMAVTVLWVVPGLVRKAVRRKRS